MPRLMFSLATGLIMAGIGCYLATTLIPGGTPRVLAQLLCVVGGLAPAALWRN